MRRRASSCISTIAKSQRTRAADPAARKNRCGDKVAAAIKDRSGSPGAHKEACCPLANRAEGGAAAGGGRGIGAEAGTWA